MPGLSFGPSSFSVAAWARSYSKNHPGTPVAAVALRKWRRLM
jgi:hypothetical protein